jgi:hypothetical protein
MTGGVENKIGDPDDRQKWRHDKSLFSGQRRTLFGYASALSKSGDLAKFGIGAGRA